MTGIEIGRSYTANIVGAAGQTELVEYATLSLYLIGLAWLPIWYGSNDLVAWGINAVLFPGLVVFYELSLIVRRRRHPVGVRHLFVPSVLFLLVVAWILLQRSSSVPASLVNPIWGLAEDALGRKLAGSISVNRDLTTLALVRLITAASAFWLALQLCRSGRRAMILIGSVAAIGFVYGAYGLIVLKTGQPHWLDIPADSGRVTATFVNHNSFATFAGMALVAVSGLILALYRRGAIVGANWRLRTALFIEATGRAGAALFAGGLVIAAALLFTGSRGGVIAAGLGLFILAVLVHQRGRNRGRGLPGSLILGALLVAAILYAYGEVVFDNFAERGISDANRMSVYGLTLRSVLDAPITGYGYGTFVEVFPMYRDRSLSVAGVWGKAHDTYLEVLQGLGLIFGALLIAAVALLALRCVSGSLHRQEHAIVPAVAASTACVVGVHNLVDFSLQIQAIALTFMAILGAGVAQSESSRLMLED